MTRPSKKEALWTKDFVLITVCNLLVCLAFLGIPSSLPIYLKTPEIAAPDNYIGLVVGVTTVAAVLFRPFAGFGVDKPGGRRRKFVPVLDCRFLLPKDRL